MVKYLADNVNTTEGKSFENIKTDHMTENASWQVRMFNRGAGMTGDNPDDDK